eukprot:s114_g14.t1
MGYHQPLRYLGMLASMLPAPIASLQTVTRWSPAQASPPHRKLQTTRHSGSRGNWLGTSITLLAALWRSPQRKSRRGQQEAVLSRSAGPTLAAGFEATRPGRRRKWVYFIRHGEALVNAAGRVFAKDDPRKKAVRQDMQYFDSRLSEKGLEQARALRASVPKVDIVAASPLTRALQTATAVFGCDEPGGPKLHAVEALREFCGKQQRPYAIRIFWEYPFRGMTALMIASASVHVEVARLLLEAGADKDCRDHSMTALMLASRRGHLEVARLLLDAGADKDCCDLNGMTALMLASRRGHLEISRLPLDAGAAKHCGDRAGMTVLMLASTSGHLEIARRLLEAGADKDCCDHGGMTALMLASYRGHSDVVHLLLEAGADKDCCDNGGMTALILASGSGHLEIARLLLEAGSWC